MAARVVFRHPIHIHAVHRKIQGSMVEIRFQGGGFIGVELAIYASEKRVHFNSDQTADEIERPTQLETFKGKRFRVTLELLDDGEETADDYVDALDSLEPKKEP